MQSLFIFSTLFSVAAAQKQFQDKAKDCPSHCYLYLFGEYASKEIDHDYTSWCNHDGPQFCKLDTRTCLSQCEVNLRNQRFHQAPKIDCSQVCKYTRRFSSEEKPAQKAVEEKPAEQSVSVEGKKPKTCKVNCFLYLFAEFVAEDLDYDYKSWCNDDGPQFCKMNTRDCLESCRLNLSGKSSKIDCNEVCKFTRAYSSEQKPAQKAVEEKPVERSLSVEEQKPVEEKPVEQSVSKKSHDCDLQCLAVLSDAISKGKFGPKSKYTYEMALHDCQAHLCHGPDSCRSGCYTNFPVGSVDCNALCKYADVRMSADQSEQIQQKPAQKAVEEKPVEQSVSKSNPSDCDLHCTAVLIDGIKRGAFGPKSQYTEKMALHDCMEHLCHGPDSCRSGCYSNFPVGSVDCNQVCKYADVRSALII